VINSRTQTRPNIKVPILCVHYGHNVYTYEIALKSALQTVPDSRCRFCHLEYHVLEEVSTACPAAQPPTPLSSFLFFLGVCCDCSGLKSGCLTRPGRGFYCLPSCHLLTVNQNSKNFKYIYIYIYTYVYDTDSGNLSQDVISSRTQTRPNTLPEKKRRMKVGSAAGQLGRQWKPPLPASSECDEFGGWAAGQAVQDAFQRARGAGAYRPAVRGLSATRSWNSAGAPMSTLC